MRYFDEMRSKTGFKNGEYLPFDAEARRDLYIRVLNSKAKEMGSDYIARAFNRPSTFLNSNNYCQIIIVHKVTDSPGIDDIFKEAIVKCRGLDIDQCVNNTCHVDDDLANFILTKGFSPQQSVINDYLEARAVKHEL